MNKAPILSPTFKWHASSSHSDPELFRQRQQERIRKAQQKPPEVAAFKRKTAP